MISVFYYIFIFNIYIYYIFRIKLSQKTLKILYAIIH